MSVLFPRSEKQIADGQIAGSSRGSRSYEFQSTKLELDLEG
jgi:hypothetical protein